MNGDRIDCLLKAYRDQLRLPWSYSIAGPQKVWIAIYNPPLERRLRLRVEEFAIETREAGRAWKLLDLTRSFADWLVANEYRDEYFKEPGLLSSSFADFGNSVAEHLKATLQAPDVGDDAVVALLGVGALFPM